MSDRPPTQAITEIDLPLAPAGSGKVRQMYHLNGDRLLLVATDRISAYDVVMDQAIPDKGKVLTQMTEFWLDELASVCPNHRVAGAELPGELADLDDVLAGRSMIAKRLKMLPIEFVIRGYLAGSGLKEYERSGSVCGVKLPEGLLESSPLPEPIFTPATKATDGHDENISEDQAAEIIGRRHLDLAKRYSLELYKRAAELAAKRGIILADTKFEFGLDGDEVVLADEILTPDSSRFWPADRHEPGKPAESLDKQYVRDWLDSKGWDRKPPPPALPPEVIAATRERYLDAYRQLTGRSL